MPEINKTDLNQTLQEIEKMFLMAAAVPASKDAEPILKELCGFLETIKIPSESLTIAYVRFKRSVGKNPALRTALYKQYTTELLAGKKRATDLVKGLQALALLAEQEKEAMNNAGELSTESEPVSEPVSELRDVPENITEDRAE